MTVQKFAWDGALDLDMDMSGFRVHEVPLFRGKSKEVGDHNRATIPGHLAPWEVLKVATRKARLAFGLFADPANLAYWAMSRKAHELTARGKYDFVISTSPPEVAHFVARAVSRTAALPWVSDYRDLWLSEMRVHQLRVTSNLSELIHRRILRDATMVTTVSKGLSNAIRRCVGREAFVSYNGFYEISPVPKERPRYGKLRIVYTGRLFEKKRDPTVFFKALAEFRRLVPAEAVKVEVLVYGYREPWLTRLIETYRLQDCVTFQGLVSYADSIAAQRDADLLLFIDWMDERAEGVLTGKLFEYLGSGRPILCVSSRVHTEASDLIRACEAGSVVTSQDEIIANLRNLVVTGRPRGVGAARVGEYSRRSQAIGLLDNIRSVLELRQPAGSRVDSEATRQRYDNSLSGKPGKQSGRNA